MISTVLLAVTTLSAPCPPVATVRSPASDERAVRIAFLPEGFTKDELPRYRCAVRTITDRLLSEAPFSTSAPRIGVERMDLVSADGWVETSASCTRTCLADCTGTEPCAYDDSDWGPECSGNGLNDPPTATEYPVRDFDVEVCGGGTGNRCEWLSVGDYGAITDLATCFTAPTLIVVLAKRFVAGGVGKAGSPPVAVVTVEGITTEAAARRLAHEMAHSLGLLDEYGSGDPLDQYDVSIPPECGRNVAVRNHCCEEGIPWIERCVPVANFDNQCEFEMVGCEANMVGCEAREVPTARWPLSECELVQDRSSCTDAGLCVKYENPPDATVLAVVEGAFYRDCCAYRPALKCRMRRHTHGFCPVCLSWLNARLEELAGEAPAEVFNVRRTDPPPHRLEPAAPEPAPPDIECASDGGPFADTVGEPSWSQLAVVRVLSVDEVVERPGFRALVPLRSVRFDFADPRGRKSGVWWSDTGAAPRGLVRVDGAPPRPRRMEGERRWTLGPCTIRGLQSVGGRPRTPAAIRIRYVPAAAP